MIEKMRDCISPASSYTFLKPGSLPVELRAVSASSTQSVDLNFVPEVPGSLSNRS